MKEAVTKPFRIEFCIIGVLDTERVFFFPIIASCRFFLFNYLIIRIVIHNYQSHSPQQTSAEPVLHSSQVILLNNRPPRYSDPLQAWPSGQHPFCQLSTGHAYAHASRSHLASPSHYCWGAISSRHIMRAANAPSHITPRPMIGLTDALSARWRGKARPILLQTTPV